MCLPYFKSLTRGGISRAMLRVAGKCLPHYRCILRHLPQALWAVMDEIGWHLRGLPTCPHVAVTEQPAAFLVAREIASILHRSFAASIKIDPRRLFVKPAGEDAAPTQSGFKTNLQDINAARLTT